MREGEITSEWTRSKDRPGDVSKTVQTEKAKITVHRPILTPEEQERRMKAIHDAAVRLIISTEQKKKDS